MSDAEILVDSASLDVREGQVVKLKASVVDADGNTVEGARIEWASGDSEIAEVTPGGTLTAKQAGNVELTASSYGNSRDFEASIRSLPKSIKIAGGNAQQGSAGTALTQPLAVLVVDRKGAPTEGIPVTFSVISGGGSVSLGSRLTDANGRVSTEWTLGQPGDQRLEASVHPDYTKVMSQSAVTFTAIAQDPATQTPPVTAGTVIISVPADTVLEIGATATLTAVARDADGILIEDMTIEWSSSNPEIMTVDDMGRLVAKTAGTVLITAAAVGCTSDTQRMVVEPPPVEAGNPATVTDLAVADVSSDAVTLRWTAVSDGAGGVADYAIRYGSPTLSWGSAYETEVAVDAKAIGETVSYTYSGLQDGTGYQFRLVSYRGTLNQGAVFGDYSNSVAAETELQSGEQPGPAIASVTATPGSHTFTAVGQTLQIAATARDAAGAIVSGADLIWASTNSSVASVSSMGLVTARGAGTAMIIVTSVCCGPSDSVVVAVEGQAPPPSSGDALFADDFESYSVGESVNGTSANGFSWTTGSYADVSNDIAYSGSRALKFYYGPTEPNGSSHWWSEQRFRHPAVQEYWIEYYIYFPDGTEGLGARYEHASAATSATNNKFFAFWADEYATKPGGYFQLWLSGDGDSRINVGRTEGPGDNIERYPRSNNGGLFVSGDADRGRWIRTRIHIRMADYGQSNGLIRLWKDNSLLINITDDPFYGPDSTHNYLRNGYLLGYDNARFAETTFIYIDSFRMYTTNPGW